MRVAFVLAALQAGGAERVVAQLSAAMVARGWSVEIITFDRPGDPIYHPLDPRVVCTRLALPSDGGGWRGAVRSARRVMTLRRLLRERQFDTVIAFLTKINVLTLAAAWRMPTPVIVSERNNPLRQQASPIWNAMTAALYRRASRIVIMSERSRRALPRASRARAAIIPNPVSAGPFVPAPMARRFVAVGRLTHQKGFDLLIDAFAMVAPSLPEWKLVIYGDGPDRSVLEQRCADRGLSDRIDLPGITEIPGSWIASSTIFILSSRYEGWPNALAEALAAGVPSIAFDCDFGAGDMVIDEQTGLLVPAEDVVALAAAMLRVATDSALQRRLGSTARNKMVQFGPERVNGEWYDIIPSAHDVPERESRARI